MTTKKVKAVLAYEAKRNAKHALIVSIIGIFILGILCEPVALYYGIKVRHTLNDINSDDSVSYAMATVAVVIASIMLGVLVLLALVATLMA